MRFWRVFSSEIHYGPVEHIPVTADRYIGFGQGYIVEIRAKPVDEGADPIAVVEIHHSGNAGDRGRSASGRFEIPKMTAAAAAAQIEALFPALATASEGEAEEAPAVHAINVRGAWQSGEQYAPLDHVTDPLDSSKGYLCQKASTSASSAVLANAAYWCEFTLPAKAD